MTKTFLIFDCETFSEADIKKVGAWEYSVHPSTELLCIAFKIGTLGSLPKAKTQLWVPGVSGEAFSVLLKALLNPEVGLVAHNALFEQVILRNVFAVKDMPSKKDELQSIPLDRWDCTAAMSRAMGLPGSLEMSGLLLKLPIQKDKAGHAVMMKLCRPRKPTKNDPRTRITDPDLYEKLYSYCKQDVEAETGIFLKLPRLKGKQREFWKLNQKMNLRGFQVDRELVQKTLKLISHETARLDQRFRFLTGLNSARQRDAVLKFLKANGAKLPDLRAGTVKEALEGKELNRICRDVLEIRDGVSRSSTAKFLGFEVRSRSDGRARDNTIWYGAHTGRDAGAGGIQPQNLFKRIFDQCDVDLGIRLIKRGDRNTIEALFEKPLELYASVLRSCIIAKPGHALEVGDFATIEVRVLFWLAGELTGLKMLENGEDLYCEMAGRIYHKDSAKIKKLYKAGHTKATMMRQLGKQTVLGAGFGIGVGGEKFQATAKQYGMDITLELAQTAITAYRQLYWRVPIFWQNIERAAILAVQNPGKRFRLGHIVWQKEGGFLKCHLPAGRPICYFKPGVATVKTNWGPKPQLSYLGTLSPSKKIGRITTWGGKLTENVVQGTAADCLYESLLSLEESKKHLPVLAVHDEAVSENEKQELSDFLKIMGSVPEWAKGLPLKVEGWAGDRYRK